MKKKLILVEFNELTPELMFKFIDEGCLPNFKKFHDSSQVYMTDAQASGNNLNPWIQWVSVHTGLSPKDHGVYRLNEATKCNGEYVWDKLSTVGLKSWICGSMNTSFSDNFKGLLIPDPWSAAVAPYPKGKFDTYFNFISQSVQEHSAKSIKVSPLAFMKYMLKSGLSLRTISKIVSHLFNEKLNKSLRWKRACILDWLQLDVFKHYYFLENPDFSTFFSNSTAHFQHHYWKSMDPKIFNSNKDVIAAGTAKAILSGYKNMDDILGDIVGMVDDNTRLIFCTGLSQKPYLPENSGDDRHFYRLLDEVQLSAKLGITGKFNFVPVMAEQFHLEFESVQAAESAHQKLKTFKMPNNSYFHLGNNDVFLVSWKDNIVHAQCRCTKYVERGTKILHNTNPQGIPFYEVFYHMDDVKSGMHDPRGMLWIYDKNKEHRVYKDSVGLEFLMPYILNYFNGVAKN
jgi:hypothetical protein